MVDDDDGSGAVVDDEAGVVDDTEVVGEEGSSGMPAEGATVSGAGLGAVLGATLCASPRAVDAIWTVGAAAAIVSAAAAAAAAAVG